MQVVQCSAWYVASAVGPSRPYVSPITSAHTGATVSAPAAAVYIAERALVDAVEHTVSVATCAWPWLLVLSGQVNALEGFLLWLYPWAVTGAIWTVMTQVSHVQEDCQQPPTGAPDDYFRWQVESAVDYSIGSELVPKLTATLNLQSMHHVMPSVCGCHFAGLYDEYAQICERHGVRLNTRKDLSDAWRTAIARVFELSSPELTPLWAVQPPPPGGLAEHVPLIAYIGTPVGALILATPFFDV